MASRMKEDEKNERIIRGLLKLPPNRRCINCNNLGPQYVCTNFWTFICTNCSGAHREFTHRVKSVSMAKFTSQEVAALQEGGNERARAVYFKEWDPQRNSYPDSSNPDKLRTFIKNVYVDQKYTGEKNVDRGARSKTEREDYNENKRADSDRSGSRSPSYEEQYGERYSSASRTDSRHSYGERSPGYDRGDYKRSPVQTEEVDNKRQDQRSEDGSHNRRLEDALKSDVKSPEHRKVVGGLSPPMVRPVRDILGDNAPRLQVGEPSKSNGIKVPENSSQTKRTLSSSSTGSSDGNTVQLKAFSSGSLIDFSAEPETSAGATLQPSLSQQTTSSSTNDGDWASFDVVDKQQISHVPATANTLESMLGELSIGAVMPASNTPVLPVSGIDLPFQANGEGYPPTMHQQPSLSTVVQPSLFPAADSKSQPSQMPVSGASNTNNQPWSHAPAANLQSSTPGSFVAPGSQLPKINTRPPQQVTAPSEQPSGGRKELPADIFALYQAPVSAAGWQRGPYPGMTYGMTYPSAMPMPAFPQHQHSGNPFDFNSNSASTFPSAAAPSQGVLPNMTAAATLQQNQNLGVPSQQWAPPQLYSPSPFMAQQFPSSMLQQPPNHMMLMGHQGIGRPNIDGTTFSNSGMDQQVVARYSHSGSPNSSGSVGGNPFG